MVKNEKLISYVITWKIVIDRELTVFQMKIPSRDVFFQIYKYRQNRFSVLYFIKNLHFILRLISYSFHLCPQPERLLIR